MNIKSYRETHGLLAKDIIQTVCAAYPKYDKALHSKVERPDMYGIRLVDDAERMLEEACGQNAPESRRTDRHRLPRRISCRVTQAEFDRLQLAITADGYDTMQSWLAKRIRDYLKRKEVAHVRRGS